MAPLQGAFLDAPPHPKLCCLLPLRMYPWVSLSCDMSSALGCDGQYAGFILRGRV